MTRFTFQGTGHIGGGGFDPTGVLVLAAFAVVGAGVASGIAEAVASLVKIIVIAVAVVAVVGAAGLAALIAHRVRHPRHSPVQFVRWQESPGSGLPSPELSRVERPAVEPARPQVVNNFFGVTPEEVAEVLRRQGGDRDAR